MTDTTLETQKMAVTRAIEAHSNAKALLFAHDGKTPINGPAVHDRELARLLAPVETAVERAIETADGVIAEVEALRLAPHADPTMALSSADLDDANRRARWIAEDCAALPLPDLVERLRAVQASGSKPSVWLHTRYAKARWQLESSKTPQAPDLPQFSEQLRELGVIGPRAGLAPEQAKRADDAANLKRWAGAQLGYVRTGKKGTGQPMGL
jgi:hypothetical protein